LNAREIAEPENIVNPARNPGNEHLIFRLYRNDAGLLQPAHRRYVFSQIETMLNVQEQEKQLVELKKGQAEEDIKLCQLIS